MPEETTNVSAPSGERVHDEGIDHIKDHLAQKQEGEQTGEGTASVATDTKPAPITEPKPPASNPGSPDASGGIPKGAGGLSATAHVESPVSSKRKSIVGTLRGFLGLEKKEKDAADVGAADNTLLGTATAVVSGAAGVVAGQTAQLTDRTKPSSTTTTTPAAATAPSSESSKPVESTDQADVGAVAASSTPDEASIPQKDDSSDAQPSETATEGGEEKQFTSTQGKGQKLENLDAIPTAGGQKLGEKHWGESNVVPDDPGRGATGAVSSADGQPTDEVADNTATNTGVASSGPGHIAATEKKTLADKVKDKLPFGKKD